MKYDRESWRWLIGEFMRHATAIVCEQTLAPGELLNTKMRKQAVLPHRRNLVRIMRNEYMQSRSQPITFHMFDADKVLDQHAHFQKLSTAATARLFGGDHSMIVRMEKREDAQHDQITR